MKLQPDGDLQIAPEEIVTVTVTAENTHYLAIFSDLQRAEWSMVEPVHQVEDGVFQERRRFVAGEPGTEAFALTLDFVRNQEGAIHPDARYVIRLHGNHGPFAVTKRILPIPPFPIGRPFLFEVSE